MTTRRVIAIGLVFAVAAMIGGATDAGADLLAELCWMGIPTVPSMAEPFFLPYIGIFYTGGNHLLLSGPGLVGNLEFTGTALLGTLKGRVLTGRNYSVISVLLDIGTLQGVYGALDNRIDAGVDKYAGEQGVLQLVPGCDLSGF